MRRFVVCQPVQFKKVQMKEEISGFFYL